MAGFKWPKQPNEQYTKAFDFADVLATAETISTKTVTAAKVSDGSDATSTVVHASAISTTKINVTLKAGTNGVDYNIKVLIVTSESQTFEMDAVMMVREVSS